MGQSLKERICSSRRKLFPIRIGPFWKSFFGQGSNQEITKVAPLYKMAETHIGIPNHLKLANTVKLTFAKYRSFSKYCDTPGLPLKIVKLAAF